MKIDDLDYLGSSEPEFWDKPVENYAAATNRSKLYRNAEGVEVLDYELHSKLLRHRGFHADHSLILKNAGITHPEVLRFRTSFLVQTRGDERVRLRTAVGEFFTPANVMKLRSDVHQIVARVLAEADDGNPLDFFERVCVRIPALVYLLLIGGAASDEAFISRISASTMKVFQGNPRLREEIEGAYLELFDYVAEQIAERRERPGDDLVSHVVRQVDVGRMSMQEAIDFVVLTAEASVDNTTNIMMTATGAVLSEPELWELLRSDPETFAPKAREESLRLYPPSLRNRRVASEDMVWEGLELPRGTLVFAPNIASGRDPSVFPKPNQFDLLRTQLRPHHAFGGGMLACLGQNIARLNVLELLVTLATSYPGAHILDRFEPTYHPPMFGTAQDYRLTLLAAQPKASD